MDAISEELRQYYIRELEFAIPLLTDAEEMNFCKVQCTGNSFLGWTDAHSESLRKLEKLLKYLRENPDNWDLNLVDLVINSIPKEQREFKDIKQLVIE